MGYFKPMIFGDIFILNNTSAIKIDILNLIKLMKPN